MKSKILNFFLIITSLLGYLEWGGNSHSFLFQATRVQNKLEQNKVTPKSLDFGYQEWRN